MKIFVIALLILLLLIGGVTANALFLKEQLDTMTDLLLSLPESTEEGGTPYPTAAEELLALWERTYPIIAVTVSAARLADIDRAMDKMRLGWDRGDEGIYEEARAELVLLLSRLRNMESLSLLSII